MNTQFDNKKFHIPTLGWIAIGLVITGLTAILLFKVSVGSVLNYGLIAAMILSHFWMHGNHGGHQGNHHDGDHTNSSSQLSPVPVENDPTQNHRHGCH